MSSSVNVSSCWHHWSCQWTTNFVGTRPKLLAKTTGNTCLHTHTHPTRSPTQSTNRGHVREVANSPADPPGGRSWHVGGPRAEAEMGAKSDRMCYDRGSCHPEPYQSPFPGWPTSFLGAHSQLSQLDSALQQCDPPQLRALPSPNQHGTMQNKGSRQLALPHTKRGRATFNGLQQGDKARKSPVALLGRLSLPRNIETRRPRMQDSVLFGRKSCALPRLLVGGKAKVTNEEPISKTRPLQ